MAYRWTSAVSTWLTLRATHDVSLLVGDQIVALGGVPVQSMTQGASQQLHGEFTEALQQRPLKVTVAEDRACLYAVESILLSL
eukprot:599220-Amphidinium_carterae.1